MSWQPRRVAISITDRIYIRLSSTVTTVKKSIASMRSPTRAVSSRHHRRAGVNRPAPREGNRAASPSRPAPHRPLPDGLARG
jgi:hypothetical protein